MTWLPTPCYSCGSRYCGPVRCRFADTNSSRPLDLRVAERDERLDELREMDRHPERYR